MLLNIKSLIDQFDRWINRNKNKNCNHPNYSVIITIKVKNIKEGKKGSWKGINRYNVYQKHTCIDCNRLLYNGKTDTNIDRTRLYNKYDVKPIN